MSFALIRLFLGGALKSVIGWLSHRSFWQLVCMALALLLVVQTVRVKAEQRHAYKVEAQLSKAIAGREADRQAYRDAQAKAAAMNKAQVAKVEQQQQKVTDDVEARYRADLARLHAEQLRHPQAQRPASGSGASEASAAPGGPGGEAVPLSGPELLSAQETELQLNALIDWVIAQSKVDPNAP